MSSILFKYPVVTGALVALLVILCGLVGCDPGDGDTILDYLAGDRRFATLLSAIDTAGLSMTLADGGPFTLLAPTDDAFDRMSPAERDALFADAGALANRLNYHLLAGRVTEAAIRGQTALITVQGGAINVVVSDDGTLTLDGAGLPSTNADTANGIVHTIDTVLVP